jgi:hypothetical protein
MQRNLCASNHDTQLQFYLLVNLRPHALLQYTNVRPA